MPLRTGIKDLENFDDTNLTDKFIIVYDAATNSFKTIDAIFLRRSFKIILLISKEFDAKVVKLKK